MRNYVADLPGGTATTTITSQTKGTIKRVQFSLIAAAAGSVELSTNPASQIGTAQPTEDVLCRMRLSATAGHVNQEFELSIPVVPFQALYVHQTGAGNVGEVNLIS